jgi:hypothetical protein
MFLIRPKNSIFFGLIFLLLLSSGCGNISSRKDQSVIEGKIGGGFLGCTTGAYVSGEGSSSQMEANILSFESSSVTSKELAVVTWYVNFYEDFPATYCDMVRSLGAVPMIVWEPHLQVSSTLEAIARGDFDYLLSSFATAAKNWGHRMFLRPMHEMNGDWYPWSGSANNSSPEAYVRAWKKIHDVFSFAGAANVTFVWSVNHLNVPQNSWNHIGNYYPGNDYVDWVGIDGYNRMATASLSSYESFTELFSNAYSSMESVAPGKPVMISEFSCADGPDKGTWITDSFSSMEAGFDKVKVFVWFNCDKEEDWRVNSNPASLASYEAAMRNSYFIESMP